jgi:hypothetical protein
VPLYPAGKFPTIERSFKGAVALANWIKRNNYFLCSQNVATNISEGCVWPAFKKAVEKHRGKPISLYVRDELKVTSTSLQAGEEGFVILIPASFNFCHARFAICKELCHVLTDDDSVRAVDAVVQLNSAYQTVKKITEVKGVMDLSPFFTQAVLSSEDFCLLLALEILIPIKERDQILSDLSLKGYRPFDIAVRLRIPETLVKFFIESRYNWVYKRINGSQL